MLITALAQAGASATQAIWSLLEVDWTHFSAVVIRTCWDYHLRVPEFLAWIKSLEDRHIAVVNHPELIRWNVDKTYLQHYAACSIAIPETIWLQQEEEADIAKLCAIHGWEQAVPKPTISYGTERRNSGQVQGPLMIQQYLRAIENEGEWSRIYFEHEFSHSVRKRPRDEDFRVQKDFAGSVEPARPSSNLGSFAEDALKLLPHPATFARVDLVEQRRPNLHDGNGSNRARTVPQLRSRFRPTYGELNPARAITTEVLSRGGLPQFSVPPCLYGKKG